MVNLIGLVGLSGSGKTTVARILEREHGYELLSLATPLKNFCTDVWGFTDAQLNGPDREIVDDRYGFSPRFVLQQLGNEIANKIDPKALTHRVARRLEAKPTAKFVIDDLRHPSQVEFVRRWGGYIWMIQKAEEQRRTIRQRPAATSEDLEFILKGWRPPVTLYNDLESRETLAHNIGIVMGTEG